MPFILHREPGPRPRLLNPPSAEEHEWQYAVVAYGLQQGLIRAAIEREEKRQANIEAYGFDPVAATTALHEKPAVKRELERIRRLP